MTWQESEMARLVREVRELTRDNVHLAVELRKTRERVRQLERQLADKEKR